MLGSKIKALVVSAVVAIAALSALAVPMAASAEKGSPDGSKQTTQYGPAGPIVVVPLADLTCSIAKSGGLVHLTVSNNGVGKASGFWTEYTFNTTNGPITQGNWYALNAGQSKTYSYNANNINSVSMYADKFGQILESNEFNNKCSRKFYTIGPARDYPIHKIGR